MEAALLIVLSMVAVAVLTGVRARSVDRQRTERRLARRLQRADYARAWERIYGRKDKRLTYRPPDPVEIAEAPDTNDPDGSATSQHISRVERRFAPGAKRASRRRLPFERLSARRRALRL